MGPHPGLTPPLHFASPGDVRQAFCIASSVAVKSSNNLREYCMCFEYANHSTGQQAGSGVTSS